MSEQDNANHHCMYTRDSQMSQTTTTTTLLETRDVVSELEDYGANAGRLSSLYQLPTLFSWYRVCYSRMEEEAPSIFSGRVWLTITLWMSQLLLRWNVLYQKSVTKMCEAYS
ncbi:hypothetical protein Pmani_030627 [Petrolisthes manimaculis]|uniref:Uncharacterized protein n=1 Tax=Petrolisthes manimaculis TaxID=1843537 RepID=A0AAE1NWA4_9EUCA|nr:hypothetical protein Pmani_030627 [Petrolisthes manimaculis]